MYSGVMSTPFALLGLLQRQPGYGYDLKRDYDRLFGQGKPLAYGQVYSTLSRLARDQLIKMDGIEADAGPDRKRYAITSAGSSSLEKWLTTPEPPQPHLQTALFFKTVMALLLGNDAERYLDAQRTAHIERMRELTRIRRSGDLAQALLADHAIFHLEADLRWIDLTAARLDDLAKDVRS